MQYTNNLYDEIGEHIYNQLTKAKMIYFNPKHHHELKRYDWAAPLESGYCYEITPDYLGRPPSNMYEFKFCGKQEVISWNCNWDLRLPICLKAMNYLHDPSGVKRLRFMPGSSSRFEKLYHYGRIIKKLKNNNEKDCYNGLLSDLVWAGARQNKLNSPIALTQTLEAQSESSFKKRLDVVAPVMMPNIASEIREIMQLLISDYGKSLIGTMDLCDKQTVYSLLNKQGATSIISKDSNIQSFIENNSEWYEICMKFCVNRWRIGQNSHSFFNVMHKNEPKKKKNVVDGKIILNNASKTNYTHDCLREELEQECLLGHRFIQYADEISRISHYIVLGNLIIAANKQKLYKGTINGTPPYLVGNILRRVWDLNSPQKERFFTGERQHGVKVNNSVKIGTPGHKTVGVIIDFSSFDTTVSVAERMAECSWMSQFFKPELNTAMHTMFSEMCYAVCLDHSGDIWLRAGQRGSGEIVTSLGNTLICISNIIRCIKRCTGSTIEEVTKTVTTMEYEVGSKKKTLEIMQYMLFGDGDDIVIITTEDIATQFTKVCGETLQLAGKVIRSGSKSGCTVVSNFHELEFCSHKYEMVLFGPNANYIHKVSDVKNYGDKKGYTIKFLPTRSSSEILGKLRATLKRETMIWDYDNPNKRAVEITRGKIMSYILLYPHCRFIRMTCLAGLSVIGDGKVDITDFKRRFPDVENFSFDTVVGALDSVYKVKTLDDISLRNYRADYADAKVLEYNATLVNFKVKVDVSNMATRLFEEIGKKKPVQPNVFELDSKLNVRYLNYIASQ